MSNLSKSKLGKFVATIVALSSISAILTTTEKAQAIPANTIMSPGYSTKSDNQCFRLDAQTDGNLVLYNLAASRAIWNSGTNGRSVKQTIFQGDGNLVIYDPSNKPIWASGTDRRGATRLTVQDDGNLVIYNAQNQAIWASNTVQPCGTPPPPPRLTMPPGSNISSNSQCFRLDAQTDGNLVLYNVKALRAIWNSGTYGKSVKSTVFQNDGDLVINDPNNNPLWRLGTGGRGATRLTVQDDGNLVMYNAQNQAIWASNTVQPCGTPPSTPTQPVANTTDIPDHCKLGGSCASTTGTKHTGVDYYSNPQGTQVKAICSGTVVRALTANDTAAWNRVTVVQYKNCGDYATLYGYYGHTNPTVKVNDSVSRGQAIGSVAFLPDTYGRDNSHLHFGLATQYFADGWGYQSGILSQKGWIDPESFGRSYGWK
jgi:hypothetical protein